MYIFRRPWRNKKIEQVFRMPPDKSVLWSRLRVRRICFSSWLCKEWSLWPLTSHLFSYCLQNKYNKKNLNIVDQPLKGTTVTNAFMPLRHPSDAMTTALLEPRQMLHALTHHSSMGHQVNPYLINGSDSHMPNCRAVGEMNLSCASDPITCPLPTNAFIPSFPVFASSNLPAFGTWISASMGNT